MSHFNFHNMPELEALMYNLHTAYEPPKRHRREKAFCPCMDVLEDDKMFIICMELPGMCDNDVNIEFEDNMLTISGTKCLDYGDCKVQCHERGCGSFSRCVKMSKGMQASQIKAKFEGGVLEVRAMKCVPVSTRRKIEITDCSEGCCPEEKGKDKCDD